MDYNTESMGADLAGILGWAALFPPLPSIPSPPLQFLTMKIQKLA